MRTHRREDDADGEECRRDLVKAAVEERRHALSGDAGRVGDEEIGLVEGAGEDRLEELGNRPAERGKHSKAAVLDLSLAVSVELGLVSALASEVERVEALVANHGGVSEDSVRLEEARLDGLTNKDVAALKPVKAHEKPVARRQKD